MKQKILEISAPKTPVMTHTMRRKLDVVIERWAPLLLVGALFVLPVFL